MMIQFSVVLYLLPGTHMECGKKPVAWHRLPVTTPYWAEIIVERSISYMMSYLSCKDWS